MAIRKKKNNGRYQILDSLQTRHSALQAQNILHKTLQAAGLPVQHIQNLFFFLDIVGAVTHSDKTQMSCSLSGTQPLGTT